MDVNDYTKVIFNIITFALIMNTNSSNFTIANHLFLTLFKVFTILRCIDNTFNPINGNIKQIFYRCLDYFIIYCWMFL